MLRRRLRIVLVGAVIAVGSTALFIWIGETDLAVLASLVLGVGYMALAWRALSVSEGSEEEQQSFDWTTLGCLAAGGLVLLSITLLLAWLVGGMNEW